MQLLATRFTPAQGQCILPGLAIVDTFVYVSLILIPLVTLGLFVISYLADNHANKKEAYQIEYHMLLLFAFLIRLSIVTVIIGLLTFFLFDVIKPGPVSGCYEM